MHLTASTSMYSLEGTATIILFFISSLAFNYGEAPEDAPPSLSTVSYAFANQTIASFFASLESKIAVPRKSTLLFRKPL